MDPTVLIYTFKNYFATVFSVFSFSNNKFNPNTPESYDGLRTREAFVFFFFFFFRRGEAYVMKKKRTKFCNFGSFAYLFHKSIKLKSNFIYFISLTLVQFSMFYSFKFQTFNFIQLRYFYQFAQQKDIVINFLLTLRLIV